MISRIAFPIRTTVPRLRQSSQLGDIELFKHSAKELQDDEQDQDPAI